MAASRTTHPSKTVLFERLTSNCLSRAWLSALALCVSLSCTTPISAALLTLDNGTVKVGLDTTYGGAITYLSQSGSATNLINSADLGREVQQSYYSGPSNFLPAGAV